MRFLHRARRAAGVRGAVGVLVTGSRGMRVLNRNFRAKDKPADVLSFPALSAAADPARFAGDVAISADIAAANARRLGHSAANEVKILVLHGILHLAGFDHERDNGQMARLELTLRQKLHLPVTLIERSQHSAGLRRRATRAPRPASRRRA